MPIEEFRYITQEEFDALVKSAVDCARQRVSECPKSIMPFLYVHTMEADGQTGLAVCALAVDFNEAHEKSDTLSAVGRRFFRESKLPMAIALVSEAWQSRWVPGTPKVEPRHDPNRREVVHVCASSLGERLNAYWRQPVRRENGCIVADGEFESPAYADVRFPVLRHFYRGFFETVMAKQGARQ